MKQYVHENKIKECNKCGEPITFIQNRAGGENQRTERDHQRAGGEIRWLKQ